MDSYGNDEEPEAGKTAKGAHVRTVADLFLEEPKMTVADLFKPDLQTVADLFAPVRKRRRFKKAFATPEGSMEDLVSRVRRPAIAASGCENKPEGDGMPTDSTNSPHWLDVVATYPDHVIVHCNDESKTWKVPYDIDGDEVVTGQSEPVELSFKPKYTEIDGDEEGTDDMSDPGTDAPLGERET